MIACINILTLFFFNILVDSRMLESETDTDTTSESSSEDEKDNNHGRGRKRKNSSQVSGKS